MISPLANIRISRILRSALLVALAAGADKSVANELAEGDLIVADFGRDAILRVDPRPPVSGRSCRVRPLGRVPYLAILP